MTRLLLPLLLLSLSVLPLGCTSTDAPSASDSAITAYDVRGRVVQRQADDRTLLVEHEAIPGYMTAMMMEFTAKSPREINGVEVGDAIRFEYIVGDDEMWIEDVERLADTGLPKHPAKADAPTRITPTDESIYQLESTWTTQAGRSIDLAAFHGRPVLMAMVFTHCSYACPVIVRDMKRIAASLPDEADDTVQRVLVSIDPARDTPEALTRFANAHSLSPDRWTLLRGSSGDVRTLAALLGVRYKPDGDGQFAHTNRITLLNAEGEIVHQQEGLTDPSARIQPFSSERGRPHTGRVEMLLKAFFTDR
jgi:protein SCO1/2